MEHYCPLVIDLRQKKCLLVGGGSVALRKANTLLSCKARLLVVSPELVPGLEKLAAEGRIEHVRGPYDEKYLQGVFLAVSCAGDAAVNRRVAGDCLSRNILVNVADNPSMSSYFFPSLVSRGPLSVAISTEGKSPAFSRLLREKLEGVLDPAYGEFLRLLGELRPRILKEVPDPKKRRALFMEMAGDRFFNLYKTLSPAELERRVQELIDGCKGVEDP